MLLVGPVHQARLPDDAQPRAPGGEAGPPAWLEAPPPQVAKPSGQAAGPQTSSRTF